MRNKILFAVFGVIILVFLNFFQSGVKNFFYTVSLPFQKTLFKAGDYISDFFETVLETKNLKRENEELRLKIQEVIAENAKLREIAEENKILREALKANPKRDFEIFISQIISKNILSSDSILIKGGLGDGIQKGFPVISPENVLVGKIEEVYNNFSRVTLISNKDFSFDVRVVNDLNKIYGLARGRGNSGIYLDKVQMGADIKDGDTLVSAALGGIFPEGLLVGKIRKVIKSDTEPFWQAEVSPFFDIKEIEKLFIIIDF
jgi:rod shape-determining protein MreC